MKKIILLLMLFSLLVPASSNNGSVMPTKFYGPIMLSSGQTKYLWDEETLEYKSDKGKIVISGPMFQSSEQMPFLNGGMPAANFNYNIKVEDAFNEIRVEGNCSGDSTSISCDMVHGFHKIVNGNVQFSFAGKPGCYALTYTLPKVAGRASCSGPPCTAAGYKLNKNNCGAIKRGKIDRKEETVNCPISTPPICSLSRSVFLLPGKQDINIEWGGSSLIPACKGTETMPKETAHTMPGFCPTPKQPATTTVNIGGAFAPAISLFNIGGSGMSIGGTGMGGTGMGIGGTGMGGGLPTGWGGGMQVCNKTVYSPYVLPLFQYESAIQLNVVSPDGTATIYDGDNGAHCKRILSNVYYGCTNSNENVEAAVAAAAEARAAVNKAAKTLKTEWPKQKAAITKEYTKKMEAVVAKAKAYRQQVINKVEWYADRMCIYYQSGACYNGTHVCCGYCDCSQMPNSFCAQKGYPNKGGARLTHSHGGHNYCDHC
jgi:hypothetical protein